MTRTLDYRDRVESGGADGAAESSAAGEATAHAGHPPHLQHHYESSAQQYEAAKFGMWLFIATEFLLFGGLFVAYAVYRGQNPELFKYGAQFLSTTMGTINTIVLILSSLTIALAVYYAQVGRTRALVTMLLLTVLGGGIFMGIKYFEYKDKFEKNLVWGMAMYDMPDKPAPPEEDETIMIVEQDLPGDPERGRTYWMNTCLACHGTHGEGIRGQALDFRETGYVAEQSDEELLVFIKQGRMPFDPDNLTGVQMPPRGGNPRLTDDQILDIIAYMRTFDLEDQPEDTEAPEAARAAPEQNDEPVADEPRAEFTIHRSIVPDAARGPAGVDIAWLEARRDVTGEPEEPLDPRLDPNRPANLHVFFGIYFMMTGLHAFHVLVGMAVITALAFLALRGRFSAAYYTPVEMGALYWHVVDVIWIFLFPLLYLIH